jgi:puromycin-sensitive aminopeptidase
MTGLVLRSAFDYKFTMMMTFNFMYIVQSFRQGLCSYLKEFSYKNAATGIQYNSMIIVNAQSGHIITEDLWAHLAEASNKPVGEVMSGWTKQLGYPVLSVEGKQVLTL